MEPRTSKPVADRANPVVPSDPEAVHAHFTARVSELTALVARVEGEANRVLDGDEKALDGLLADVAVLRRAVATNLDEAGAVLAPTLATIDAWGDVRRERLEEAMEDARERIRHAEHEAAIAPTPKELATAVRTLLAHVLSFVRIERRDALRDAPLDEHAPPPEDTFTG